MTKDITDNLNNLCNFTNKLIILLEEELNRLSSRKNKNNIVATKNAAEILNKLVSLITQLNKLSNSYTVTGPSNIDEKDKIIIDNFLKNYSLKNFF